MYVLSSATETDLVSPCLLCDRKLVRSISAALSFSCFSLTFASLSALSNMLEGIGMPELFECSRHASNSVFFDFARLNIFCALLRLDVKGEKKNTRINSQLVIEFKALFAIEIFFYLRLNSCFNISRISLSFVPISSAATALSTGSSFVSPSAFVMLAIFKRLNAIKYERYSRFFSRIFYPLERIFFNVQY